MKFICIIVIVAFYFPFGIFGQQKQGNGEKTVEESYLQDDLEALIISEQANAPEREMKVLALQYSRQAMDNGKKTERIRASLEFLALEKLNVAITDGGTGRVVNNYPDIRAKASEYLAEFPSEQTKQALLKLAYSDSEPMVAASAIKSLGKIGLNDKTTNDVVSAISYVVTRFDVLSPDNSLAFEAITAINKIADANNIELKDYPEVLRTITRISSGNYIKAVKKYAEQTKEKLRKKAISSKKNESN